MRGRPCGHAEDMTAELEVVQVWDLDLREVSGICERPAGAGRTRQLLAVEQVRPARAVLSALAAGRRMAAAVGEQREHRRLEHADRALMLAKRTGKGRVAVANPDVERVLALGPGAGGARRAPRVNGCAHQKARVTPAVKVRERG